MLSTIMIFSITLVLATLTLGLATSYNYSVPPYGTKTGYYMSLTQEELQLLKSTQSFVPDVCTPIHVDSIIRHGSRYPGSDDMEEMRDCVDRLRGQVHNPDLAALNDTTMKFDLQDDKLLAEQGMKELEDIGRRFANRWRSLLQNATEKEIFFECSTKMRTLQSGRSFMTGLGDVLGYNMTQPIIENERIIRYYKYCPLHEDSVEDNQTALSEYELFQTRPELTALIDTINAKFNMDPSIRLTLDEIKLLWKFAAFETNILGSSEWAKLFTWDEKDLIQYSDDLENWLVKGYAYPLNYEMACPMLHDMFSYLDKSKEAHKDKKITYTKGVFRFGHSSTLHPLETLMGLYKDDIPLKHDNYDYQKLNRKFRADRTLPMATSITYALYYCNTTTKWSNMPPPGIEWPSQLEEYMVQLLVREMPERFPVCDTHFCDYTKVRESYADYIDNCNQEELCKIEKTVKSSAISINQKLISYLITAVLLFA